MGEKRKFLLLALIMMLVALGGTVISITVLYRAAFDEERVRLVENARSQARLIEAVARFDSKYSGNDFEGGAFEATLSQIREAHANFEGFGETGEFTLAKREGDQILFVLNHRHQELSSPEPVPFSSKLAEPMRRALLRESGTIVGLDYRGAMVVAAYEPVAELNLGIVAKIDLAEIRAPFIRAGLLAGSGALGFTLIGLILFVWIGNPLVRRLESDAEVLRLEIEERKRAEEELSRSEYQYHQVFHSSLAVKLLIDPRDGQIVEANDAARQFYGYSSEELRTLRITDINTLSEEEVLKEMELARTEKRCFFSFRHRLASGEIRDVEVYSGPLQVGENTLLYSIIHDVTQRKIAEEALRDSEMKYRTLIESSPYCIHQIDLDGFLLTMNQAGLDMLGLEEESQATGSAYLDNVSEEDRARISALMDRAIIGEQAEFEFQGVAGQRFRSNFVPIRNRAGEVIRLFGITQDVTDQKRVEQERLRLERQVQQAQKLESLGVLAGGVAHDFNNLLMVILGNSDLALTQISPHSPARGNLQEIEKASRRAADLAKQMLAYSGKGRFVIEPIALNEFIEEMGHLLEVSISKKIVLKYNFADNLPTFDGDSTQIRQIIMNLITNASEAIGKKSGVIALSTGAMECDRAYLDKAYESQRVSGSERLHEGVYCYLEVADTGCGMDTETIEKIFDPFFTTKFTGRGLGMSAVLGIVRGHGGALRVYSEVGKGSTFKIVFPANEMLDDSPVVRSEDPVDTKGWRGSGTVLVVDDEESVCAVGKRMLELMGFKVLTAQNGREALSVFCEKDEEIVCVLLDLTMPHMDGEEAFREMRRLSPGVKVVLCSGYNEQDATQRFAGKGLAGFIQKPYTGDELRSKLRNFL